MLYERQNQDCRSTGTVRGLGRHFCATWPAFCACMPSIDWHRMITDGRLIPVAVMIGIDRPGLEDAPAVATWPAGLVRVMVANL
jgi:hypothetical protein